MNAKFVETRHETTDGTTTLTWGTYQLIEDDYVKNLTREDFQHYEMNYIRAGFKITSIERTDNTTIITYTS